MQKISVVKGIVVPINRTNIDTDAIIPKQFLKSIKRTGFGPNLFDEWRYLNNGEIGMDCSKRPLNMDFSLNQPRYAGAKILLAQANFGCGSSREHAPWAIKDYGIDVVVAPSFADIFYDNSMKNALLPVVLAQEEVDFLFEAVEKNEGYQLNVDLLEQVVITPDGQKFSFPINEFSKECLINGLDDIGLTLKHADAIKDFEQRRQLEKPWLA
jgi:3-isopropylmalate/(R)-2-methylmalate dehydratase small subunit